MKDSSYSPTTLRLSIGGVGPCVPDVYYEYGNNGSLPIDVAGKGEPINPEDVEKFDWAVIWYLVCVLRDRNVLSEMVKMGGM